MKSSIFQKIHELWLSILFGSFSVKNDKIFDILYDFAMIEFRHLSWLGDSLVEVGKEFDFEKDTIDFVTDDTFSLFDKLVKNIRDIQSHYPKESSVMYERFKSDENYFIQKIELLMKDDSNFEKITAFDKRRVMDGYDLNQEQLDAMTHFLFDECYKEYELILVYAYANFYTDSKLFSSIFQDLIYESQFHLKSFARLMRSLGILAVPRTIMESIYKFDDLEKFLIDGIKEEEAAKEECLKLAKAINHPEFSNFFTFINYQENYHIELMKKALKHIKGKEV
jgi:rubrerythrin